MKKQKPDVEAQHTIAAGIIGTEIEWESDTRGFYTCPLAEGHTSKTGPRHSRVDLDGVPTFFCWHSTCRDFTADASTELRKKLDFRTPEEKEEARIRSNIRLLLKYDALLLRSKLEWIYEKFAWYGILDRPYSPADSWRIFINLWSASDVVWIGECWDTGREQGIGHFKTVDEWSCHPPNLYANRFTSAATYQPGSVDRTQKQVCTVPYIVIEFDALSTDKKENKERSAAFFRYLSAALTLVMVVDSGNKSLHGWFKNDVYMTDEVKFFLRQLGADINTMRPSQPVRLPGAIRDNGNVQSVLWRTQ